MKTYVIIVAGGSGKRMGSEIPKQFIVVAGKPIIMHTFMAFEKCNKPFSYILVLPREYHEYWQNLCAAYNFTISHKLVAGGDTRFKSVKNGLSEVSLNCIVAIHDGVRPLVSQQTITDAISKALTDGNAIPYINMRDSLRFYKNNSNHVVDRNDVVAIQTPQVFYSNLIINAYKQGDDICFSDDATVLEKANCKINLIQGNRENIKITFPEDIWYLEMMLTKTL